MSSHANGIVTYVHHLRSELLRQGHRVSVFTGLLDGRGAEPNVFRIKPAFLQRVLPKLGRSSLAAQRYVFGWGRSIAAALNEVHRKDPIDVIEMEESFGWCATVRRLVSIPVVVKLHGPAFLSLVEEDLHTPFARARIEREGEALTEMPVVLAPTESVLTDTIEHYKLKPRLVRVIPNPFVIDSNAEPWSVEKCDRKTILFVGRFNKRKGGDIVLGVFRQLLKRDTQLRLIFVGPDVGVESAHGTRIFFSDFANAHFSDEQRKQIDYRGALSWEQVSALRTRPFVTVLASRWENQPNTAIEAMARGCPVVAVDAGGMREIVQDGSTGLLARAGDIADLCSKIWILLNDPIEARRLGEAAQRFVIEHYAPQAVAEATLSAYREAIAWERASK